MTTPPRALLVPTTSARATAQGWSPTRLQRAVADGRVRRVLRGVYVDATVPDGTDLRAAAAALLLPDRMIACDRSAAWLLGVDQWDPTDLDVPPLLDMTAREGTRTRRRGIHGSTRTLHDEDVMVIDPGILVTTPLRTAADLACQRGRLAAAAALDQFARQHGVTTADLRRLLLRFGGRRGVTQLRELAQDVCALAESPPETWVRRLILDHQLPPPTPQHVVQCEGSAYRLDLAYPHLRIAIEYDGEEHHTTAADREADRLRRLALRRAGWIVIVVRKDDLAGTSLDGWIRLLRAAIQERRRPWAPRYARGLDAGVHRRR